MTHYVCATCGTQFPDLEAAPPSCPICQDQRQYVEPGGQQWTTLDELKAKHHNHIAQEEPGLYGVGMEPGFAINQRALLVQRPDGNILWDCITVLDDMAVTIINALGGIKAIAISHPHYYSAMVEWSRAFDAPIFLHAADQQWVMRPDPAIRFWDGETCPLDDGVTLVRCGGHFAGGTVLHWTAGAEGRGVLLTGDIINVVSDRRYVSFMYSFPNLIPLNARAVRQVVEAVEPFEYDRIYGAWWGRVVPEDAKAAVRRSADRYIRAIEDGLPA